MNPQRTCRYYLLKLNRLKGDPQSLAKGTAIGIFLGITPIIPLHTALNVMVTVATRTSTIASILASVLVCNPLTYIPQYYFAVVIGNGVTPYNFSWESMRSVLDLLLAKPGLQESFRALVSLGVEALVVLVSGGSLLALPFAIISYFLALRFFHHMNSKRRRTRVSAG